MTAERHCEEFLRLLPELALGIGSDRDRKGVLAHVDQCPDCRRAWEEVSAVAADLLLLAPTQDPPPEFATRVVQRIAAEQAPGRQEGSLHRWRRRLVTAPVAAAAASVLAMGLVGSYVYSTTGDEREIAARYRETLRIADGTYFGALALRGPSGEQSGHVFGYQGRPSWVFVVAPLQGRRPAQLTVVIDTRTAGTLRLGELRPTGDVGTLGVTLPVPFPDVTGLRVVNEGGTTVLTADAPPPP